MKLAILMFLLTALSAPGLTSQQVNDSTSLAAVGTGESGTVSPAGLPDSLRKPVTVGRMFTMVGDNLADQVGSVFTMNNEEATRLLIIAGIAGGLIAADDMLDNNFHTLFTRNKFIRTATDGITEIGGNHGIIGTALFAGYGLIFDDKKAQETSLLLGQALITSGVWARIGKLFIGRERPSFTRAHDHGVGGHWHGISGPLKNRWKTPSEYDAFPSGHTTTVFAIATVIATQYESVGYVPEISYGIATLVGLSRMFNRTHWASDVFVGGCLGYLCAKQVIGAYRREYIPISGPRVNFGVTFRDETPLLSMTIDF